MKGGEELRIDQRMEQLLDVANALLAGDPGAAAHRLQVLRCQQPEESSWSLWHLMADALMVWGWHSAKSI